MTLTTHIRLTKPVDPREVWAFAQAVIGVPEGYRWEVIPAGAEYRAYPDSAYGVVMDRHNGSIHAPGDQGAGALMWLHYGHEGALLIDDPGEVAELAEAGAEPYPAAYAELCIDTPYGADVDHQPWIAAVLAKYPGALWWQGECCGEWHDVPNARYQREAAQRLVKELGPPFFSAD